MNGPEDNSNRDSQPSGDFKPPPRRKRPGTSSHKESSRRPFLIAAVLGSLVGIGLVAGAVTVFRIKKSSARKAEPAGMVVDSPQVKQKSGNGEYPSSNNRKTPDSAEINDIPTEQALSPAAADDDRRLPGLFVAELESKVVPSDPGIEETDDSQSAEEDKNTASPQNTVSPSIPSPRPLDDIRKRGGLLKLPKRVVKYGEASPQVVLAKVLAESNGDCSLSLYHGDKKPDPKHPPAFSLHPDVETNEDAKAWIIQRHIPNAIDSKSENIGKFILVDQSLKFQWIAGVSNYSQPEGLKYQLLDIAVGEDKVRCRLTSPKKPKLDPIKFRKGEFVIKLPFSSDAIPNPHDLRLKLIPKDFPTFTLSGKEENEKDESGEEAILEIGKVAELKFEDDIVVIEAKFVAAGNKKTHALELVTSTKFLFRKSSRNKPAEIKTGKLQKLTQILLEKDKKSLAKFKKNSEKNTSKQEGYIEGANGQIKRLVAAIAQFEDDIVRAQQQARSKDSKISASELNNIETDIQSMISQKKRDQQRGREYIARIEKAMEVDKEYIEKKTKRVEMRTQILKQIQDRGKLGCLVYFEIGQEKVHVVEAGDVADAGTN